MGEQSDFVILGCPLTETTKGLIGSTEFSMMKPTAYLINIARGPVIDEVALYDALCNNTIGGAAIDVWFKLPDVASGQRECAPYDFKRYPFHNLENLLMSPHTSGWS